MNVGKLMRWMAVAAVVVLCGMAWHSTQHTAGQDSLERAATPIVYMQPSTADDEGRPIDAVAHAQAQAEQRAATRDLDRARRDALHERILDRERFARRVAGDRPGADQDEPDREGDAARSLTNRMGPGHEALAAAINRDFLGLADECIEQATARSPALRGMLAIEVAAVGDEELGAVIEDVGYPEANEIHEPELLECLRETSLSMSLPPPPEGGRTEFMITMPIGETA